MTRQLTASLRFGAGPRASVASVTLPWGGLALVAACAAAQTPPSGPAPAGAPEPPAAAPAPALSSPAWLVADDAGKSVTLALQVTPAPDSVGSGLLNGHRGGDVQIVIPLGWTVQWDWRSADSAHAHSLVVMAEREKLPTEGGRAVFTNAMTRMVTAGLPAGQGDRTTFIADQAGWYWMLCGVPGHAIGGEYLGLRVDPDARTASVKTK